MMSNTINSKLKEARRKTHKTAEASLAAMNAVHSFELYNAREVEEVMEKLKWYLEFLPDLENVLKTNRRGCSFGVARDYADECFSNAFKDEQILLREQW